MRYAHSLGSMSSAKMDGKLNEPLDYINLILQIVEHLLSWIGPEIETTIKPPYLIIDSNKKIQRAYIVKDCQIVSFAFPFQVYDKQNDMGVQEWHVRYRNIDITSTVLSYSRGLYNDFIDLRKTLSFHEIASAQNLSDTDVLQAIKLFEVLMMMEPAYVRYDYDPKGSKGLKHPLCHFDYNFIECLHYKVGLHGRLSISQVEDIISKDTDCWYLAKYKESLTEKKMRIKERLSKAPKGLNKIVVRRKRKKH